MKRFVTAVSATAAVLSLAACGNSGSTGSSADGPTDMPTVAGPTNALGSTGAAPAVPGYQSLAQWTFRITPGTASFTPASGPQGEAWPLAPGNCTDQWFQVQWHASNPQSTFVAGYGASKAVETRSEALSRGWLTVDGCQLPQWQRASGSGSVIATAKVFQPAG